MIKMTMGLCKARHEMPVSEFVFENTIANPTDLGAMMDTCHAKLYNCKELTLYVTGLTVALVTVINYCCMNHISLKLMHYDIASKQYFAQEVETQVDYDLLVEAGYKTKK